jgi:hypothetical protein
LDTEKKERVIMTLPQSHRLAYKLRLPLEMQQLGNQMLDAEGFCACGRLIHRLEGKFLLAAVMPSKEMTTLAAYCQPCSQVIQRCLLGLRQVNFMDKREALPGATVPHIIKPVN